MLISKLGSPEKGNKSSTSLSAALLNKLYILYTVADTFTGVIIPRSRTPLHKSLLKSVSLYPSVVSRELFEDPQNTKLSQTVTNLPHPYLY